MDAGARQIWVEIPVSFHINVHLLPSYLTYKMDTIIVINYKDIGRIKWEYASEELGPRPGK